MKQQIYEPSALINQLAVMITKCDLFGVATTNSSIRSSCNESIDGNVVIISAVVIIKESEVHCFISCYFIVNWISQATRHWRRNRRGRPPPIWLTNFYIATWVNLARYFRYFNINAWYMGNFFFTMSVQLITYMQVLKNQH